MEEDDPRAMMAEKEFGVVCTNSDSSKTLYHLAEAMGLDVAWIDTEARPAEFIVGHSVQKVGGWKSEPLEALMIPMEKGTQVVRLCEILGLDPPSFHLVSTYA
ncbi:MAG: hypothetical protein ACOYNN_15635 [Terrimicrobiaceae bacterium]